VGGSSLVVSPPGAMPAAASPVAVTATPVQALPCQGQMSPNSGVSSGVWQARPVPPRSGGSGRLPPGGPSGGRRASTSAQRWRDPDGSFDPCGRSPQSGEVATYTPRHPNVVSGGLTIHPVPSLSPRRMEAHSPRAQSPARCHEYKQGAQQPSFSVLPPAQPPELQRRLADLERSLQDFRIETKAELSRITSSLDAHVGAPSMLADLRMEVCTLHHRVLELEGVGSRASSPTVPSSAGLEGGSDVASSARTMPTFGFETAALQAMPVQASCNDIPRACRTPVGLHQKGEICDVVRTALDELERLTRLACQGLEAASADRLHVLRRRAEAFPGEQCNSATDAGSCSRPSSRVLNGTASSLNKACSPSPVSGATRNSQARRERCASPLAAQKMPSSASATSVAAGADVLSNAGSSKHRPTRRLSGSTSNLASGGGSLSVGTYTSYPLLPRGEELVKSGTSVSISSTSTCPPRLEGESSSVSTSCTSTSPRDLSTVPGFVKDAAPEACVSALAHG